MRVTEVELSRMTEPPHPNAAGAMIEKRGGFCMCDGFRRHGECEHVVKS